MAIPNKPNTPNTFFRTYSYEKKNKKKEKFFFGFVNNLEMYEVLGVLGFPSNGVIVNLIYIYVGSSSSSI